MSYGAVIINLIGTMFVGKVLLTAGFENRDEENFNQFKFFCGEKLGAFYSALIILTLIMIMPVLISGAGATLFEYYGINRYIGSALMAVVVLCAYLIGFERLVKVISSIGPLIIIFSLTVGLITIFRDFDKFPYVASYEALLSESSSSPHWLISGILYLSLNMLSGSTYFVQLGISAESRKDAKYGALLGAGAFGIAVAIVSSAILLNGSNASSMAIPVLYLAKKISYVFGAVFSVALILGIFSASSAMMWSICSKFKRGGKKGNQIFAVGIAVFTFILGCFSFSGLISVLYPMVGYAGLAYIGCVIYRGIKDMRNRSFKQSN